MTEYIVIKNPVVANPRISETEKTLNRYLNNTDISSVSKYSTIVEGDVTVTGSFQKDWIRRVKFYAVVGEGGIRYSHICILNYKITVAECISSSDVTISDSNL